jgi:hypothetical protein
MSTTWGKWGTIKSNTFVSDLDRTTYRITTSDVIGYTLSNIGVDDSFWIEFFIETFSSVVPGDHAVGLVEGSGGDQENLLTATNIMYRSDGEFFDKGVQTTLAAFTVGDIISFWRLDDGTITVAKNGSVVYTTNSTAGVYRKAWFSDDSNVRPRVRCQLNAQVCEYPELYQNVPNPGFLRINPGNPTMNTQPKFVSVNAGDPASFTIDANENGGGTLSYQWYFKSVTQGTQTLTGETGASLSGTAAISWEGKVRDSSEGYYYCEITNSGGSLKSNLVGATIAAFADPPTIISTSGHATMPVFADIGESLLNVTAEGQLGGGAGPLSYEWFVGETNTYLPTSIGTTQLVEGVDLTALPGTRYVGVIVTDDSTGEYAVGPASPAGPINFSAFDVQVFDQQYDSGSDAQLIVANPAGFSFYKSWYKVGYGNVLGANDSDVLTIQDAVEADSGTYYYVAGVGRFESPEQSNPAVLTINPVPSHVENVPREALVWNFEDDNYTWCDPGPDVDTRVDGAISMQYIFEPGWQTRWSDLEDEGLTWEDLQNAGTRWSDFYGHGQERNVFFLTAYGLYKSDQFIKVDGVKNYYIQRNQIDLDDVVQAWTSNTTKHIRKFVFHNQSSRDAVGDLPNIFRPATGWTLNLMDQISWGELLSVDMQTTNNNGTWKVDLRETGRYLSIFMEFNATQQFRLTGGELDMEEAHGR